MINTSKIYKMRIVFRFVQDKREPNLVFNAVRKMILASGLPFEPAKVNKKWPRFSYGPALPKDICAWREYVDVYLVSFVPADEVKRKLEEVKPPLLEIIEVQRVPYALPSVQNLVAAVQYRVKGNFASFTLEQTVENYFSATRVEVVYRSANGCTLVVDARPYILQARMLSAEEMQLLLCCVNGKWFPPQELVASYLGIEIPRGQEAFTVDGFSFIREGLYWKDSQGLLHLI
jgi:radical SAM-linked protein